MIRPFRFFYNEETAIDNVYQNKELNDLIHENAIKEFDDFVTLLRDEGVNVKVFLDKGEFITPDSIFPNNWISFHEDELVIYPMYASNRRLERRNDIVDKYKKNKRITDFSPAEDDDLFLEGTGSLVLDRFNRIAYASLSKRTSIELVNEFCEAFNYSSVTFSSFHENAPIYHTNVILTLGDDFVVVCFDLIPDKKEVGELTLSFAKTGKRIIEITPNQVKQFAGNMLQLQGHQKLIVMSKTAYDSLNTSQIEELSKGNKLIFANLETIERIGGGSARCMICEVF